MWYSILMLLWLAIVSCEDVEGECEERLRVETVDWGDIQSPSEIASRRRPLLLRNSPASGWKATRRWGSVKYLQENLPNILENSYRSKNSSEFSYLSVAEDHLIDLPKTSFLASLSSKETSFMMYSAPLLRCCKTMLEDLIDDVSSPDTFSLDGIDSEMTAWFGTEGITTAIHCDMFQHNFFVQIAGRKTFELWHPKSHFDLYLHSSLVPQARESRVRDQDSKIRYPNFATAQPAVVDLGPGDVLYIPPHYFHRVTSRRGSDSRLSVSLSIWAERVSERDVLDSVRSLPLPFESNWSDERLRDEAGIFLLDVAREALRTVSPRKFVHTLVRSRHGKSCKEKDTPTSKKDSSLHARNVAEALRMLHVDIIEIHLGDYIEEVANYVVNHQSSNDLSRVAKYLCQI